MSDDTEYRFKTWAAHGHIVLTDATITCDTTSYLGRWKTTTPYSAIEPHPISLWYTPPATIYLCVALAFFALVGIASVLFEMRSNDWHLTLVAGFYAVFTLVNLAIWIRVVRHWRTEWISFPTSIEGHRIAYIKTRNNEERFEHFTDTLQSRISAARPPT